MYLITAIPITRNKFQKPELFFSSHNFTIGSVVLAPLGKAKKEKPMIVISSENLKDKKSFVRRGGMKIGKIKNDFSYQLLDKKTLDFITTASQKTEFEIEEIFQKIFTKKITKELNKINSNPVAVDFRKFTKKITIEFIKSKLIKQRSKETKKQRNKFGIKIIGSLVNIPKTKKTLHSEKHYLVDEIRNYFGETAKKGKGSFGFYLGFFNRIPKQTIYQYWSEAKQSNKSIKDQQKLFWWKIGKYLKDKKG